MGAFHREVQEGTRYVVSIGVPADRYESLLDAVVTYVGGSLLIWYPVWLSLHMVAQPVLEMLTWA